MKAIKYISFVIVGLVVLILLLFCALVLFFNPNNYKADIQKIVREQANIELNIEGNISWTFYPWLGISIQNTSAASVVTPDRPFAKIKELDLSVRLLPLFKGEIKMNDVNLDGLVVDLQKDENGHTNWDKVGQAETNQQTAQTETKPTEKKDTGSSSGKLNLDINSITINNTKVSYKDLKTGDDYAINNVHLSTGVIRIGEPILVKLGANLKSKQPAIDTSLQLQGKLVYDLEQQLYQVNDLLLTSKITGEPLNGKTATFNAKGDLIANLKANTAQWNKLYIELDTLKITGGIKASNITSDNPTVEGNLAADTFNLKNLLTEVGISLPEMADKNALTGVSFSTTLKATTKNATLNSLKIKLDNTNFTGSVAVTDFAKQIIKVQLKGDTLNADNYLPPEAKKTANQTTSSSSNSSGTATSANTAIWTNDVLLDPKSLRGINVDVDFGIDQLTVKKLPWQGFVAKVIANNGIINIQNVGGKLFTGSINLKGTLNAQSSTPKITLQPTINNIPIDKLLTSQGMDLPIKGNVNLTGNLNTAGISQITLVKNLNGTANFVVNNGELVGINYEHEFCKGVALLNKKSLSTKFTNNNTAFSQLKAALNITNGIANNQDLIIAIPGLTAKGKGTFNIVTMMIDYNIGLTVTGDKREGADAACQIGKEFVDIEFPLVCRGSALSGGNICTIDQQGIAKQALKYGENKAKEKLTEKLNEKLDGKLGKKLDKAPAVKGILKGILDK